MELDASSLSVSVQDDSTDVNELRRQLSGSRQYNSFKPHFLHCLVFKNEDTKKYSLEELQEFRQEVLDLVVDAGLKVELFFSVQHDEIYCKIGANDVRLLQEADVNQYQLDIDPDGMKVVAEGNADEERGPIHLEPPFSKAERFQKLNGKYNWEPMSDDEIVPFLRQRSTLSPFEQIHSPYNSEWEEYAMRTYQVQMYRRFSDGSILRTADRMKLIKIILERSIAKHPRNNTRGAGLNLDVMVYEGKLLGSFPLNTATASSDANELSVEELHHIWVGRDKTIWERIRTPWKQPLQEIRDYFGEKIAFYFAFLGHYTLWLFIPALIGLGIFLHQMISVRSEGATFLSSTKVDTESINGTFIAKVYTEVPEIPYFALFISIWATLFVEFWKRKEAIHALRWGMIGFEKTEKPRVEFLPSHRLPSMITGRAEPYYSSFNFLLKITGSSSVLFLGICLVIITIIAVLTLKVALTISAKDGESNGVLTPEVAPILALCIQAVLIQILGAIYRVVARKLNDWENHRTDTQYEDNLIIKSFAFNFVNSYATLFYFAFVKSGSVILEVEQYCTPAFEKVRAEDPDTIVVDNCFGGLGYSLLIIFATQLVVNNATEIFLPWVLNLYQRYTNLKEDESSNIVTAGGAAVVNAMDKVSTKTIDTISDGVNRVGNTARALVGGRRKSIDPNDSFLYNELQKIRTKSPAEDQFYLGVYESTFNDFLELALQFGYVTLFVAAFPLAPFLALVNNFLEIRVDSFKLCKLTRRPEMMGAQDIGTWQKIFTFLGFVAVISNAGVVCFTSKTFISDEFIINLGFTESEVYGGRVWVFNFFIVTVLGIKWVLGNFVADVPQQVTIQAKRNEYFIKKCFLRERDDLELRDGASPISRTESSTLHLTPKRSHVINSSDPQIEKLLLNTARSIRKRAQLAPDSDTFEREVTDVFMSVDQNGSGSLSPSEFAHVIKECGGSVGEKLSKGELETLIHALDTNGNGRIDYREFHAFLKAATVTTSETSAEEENV